MSNTVIEFIDGDISIFVETKQENIKEISGGMAPAGVGSKLKSYVIKSADGTFTEAMKLIGYTSNTLINEIKGIKDQPAQAEIQFDIKINAEGKAMIASGGIDASCSIKLVWLNK